MSNRVTFPPAAIPTARVRPPIPSPSVANRVQPSIPQPVVAPPIPQVQRSPGYTLASITRSMYSNAYTVGNSYTPLNFNTGRNLNTQSPSSNQQNGSSPQFYSYANQPVVQQRGPAYSYLPNR